MQHPDVTVSWRVTKINSGLCSHSTAGSKHIPVTLFQIVPVGKTQPVTLSALETSETIYECERPSLI